MPSYFPIFKKKLRLLRMGLSTILGLNPQGFFIPYRYTKELSLHKKEIAYSQLEILFREKENAFIQHIEVLKQFTEDLRKIGQDNPPQPRWDQDWFPPLDAAIAYSIVRTYKPELIIEVGSGHSTRFMSRAIEDGLLETKLCCVDPAPRAEIDGTKATLINDIIQNTEFSLFKELKPGDILFVDSSHIIMPGTDVDIFLNHIFPILPSGVLIQVHDIFLPDNYPEEWAWRGYNEQSGLATLLYGPNYEVVFSSHYVTSRMESLLQTTILREINHPENNYSSSLWIRKI